MLKLQQKYMKIQRHKAINVFDQYLNYLLKNKFQKDMHLDKDNT